MIKFYKYWLVLSILILNLGCTNEEYRSDIPENILKYEINPLLSKSYVISDLISEYSFISLELPESDQIAGIRKAIFSDNHIYLLDMSPTGSQPQILAFDIDGKHKFTIKRTGRGPGEYEYIYDFDITDDHLIIVTPVNILFYDRKNGSYIKTHENRFDGTRFQWMYFFNDETGVAEASRGRANLSKHHLKFFDLQTTSVIYEAVPFPSHALLLSHSYRVLFETEQGLRSRPVNSNIVYSVEMNTDSIAVRPKYLLDFDDLWIPESFLSTSFRHMDQIFTERQDQDYIHTVEVFEKADLLYITYEYGGNTYVYLYDKQINQAVNISEFKDNQISWPMKPITVFGEQIVGIVYPFEIQDEGLTIDPVLQEIIDKSGDDGQPVLIFARFDLSQLEL